jgi:uncharacterized membrane protein
VLRRKPGLSGEIDMETNFLDALISSERNISSNERIVSLASGAALLGYGLYRRGVLGFGAILVSAALWDRGIRGHCAVSEILGRNTAESREEAIRHVESKYAVTIDKPSEEIYRYFNTGEGLRKILGGGEIAEIPTEASSASGLSRNGSARDFSPTGQAALPLEITSRSASQVEWRQPPLLGSVDLRKAPGNRGTEVRVSIRPAEPFQLTQRFTAYLTRSKLRRGLRQLKQQLESGDIPTIVGQPSGRLGGRDLHSGITLAELTSSI